jgi:hypothetical protein
MYVRINGTDDLTKGQYTHYLQWNVDAQNYVCCCDRDQATEFDDVTRLAQAVAHLFTKWGYNRQSEGAVVTVVKMVSHTVVEEEEI